MLPGNTSYAPGRHVTDEALIFIRDGNEDVQIEKQREIARGRPLPWTRRLWRRRVVRVVLTIFRN
jgi:hypothetical protein